MGGGEIPVRVSFAGCKNTAVPHIDGNQDFFPRMGGNRALSENHFVSVNVIVNGVKCVQRRNVQPGQNDFRHPFPVSAGKPLADFHVVKVVFQILSVDEAEVFRHGRLMVFPVQRLQRGFNFLTPPRGFVFRNERVPLCEIFLFPFVQVNGEMLVIFRHLFP